LLLSPWVYPDENYFSSHFHLGYRKFEAGEPEVFLFGELNDINFLPSKPVAVSEHTIRQFTAQ
jgi:hypothetical protein